MTASNQPGDTIIELRGSGPLDLERRTRRAEFFATPFRDRNADSKICRSGRKYRVKILDTRKTTPGLRALEKAAVVAGGGTNHRFGLFDMVLVKDNHLIARSGVSGIADAVRRVRKERPDVRIEVEADHLDQVRALLEIDDVDVILLDNMKPAEMREAVALGKNKVKFEASGGITLKNVRQIAATGVDYISVGALTHSAPAINLSLEIRNVAP